MSPGDNSMAFDTTPFEIGKNRIEALSDGLFAIVMTLLILEFHVPNLPSSAPNVDVAPATTLTAFICFWSVGISLAIYLLLLPLCTCFLDS